MARAGHFGGWVWAALAAGGLSALAGAGMGAAGGRAALARGATAEETPSYARDIRPILVRSCLKCHGYDPSTREAELRLDTFAHATAPREGPDSGAGAAIVPGDPEGSLLIQRVGAHDPADRMPPEGEPLSAAEIDLLRRWIAAGAEYEEHWSLRPVRRVERPAVEDAGWGRGRIDAFVRARQEAAGLDPAPEADRRTLIRRLSFDLTGLPPTPEEVAAFEADEGEGAVERLVDRLLASRHFGERWGRHWLDLMRYAETYAHEYDYPIRNAHEYRDYVIRALNADVPYDQFVTEHIAGDLMPSPRRHPEEGYDESVLGTTFWWLSQGTHAPVDLRMDEAERIDNQIDVLSKAFLATTVSCARCHDHKFDPIPTKEYYGLSGFIQSSRRREMYIDPGGRIEAGAQTLRELQGQIEAELDAALGAGLWSVREQAPALLPAAVEVLFGEPAQGEVEVVRGEVFESFDGEAYEGWMVEGDAFGAGPSRASEDDLTGAGGTAKGAGFANSHVRLEGDGSVDADKRVGRLLSGEFTIGRRYLHALVGGGDHAGKTGLRVLVDGEPVAAVTGFNSLHMRPARLDLAAWRGRAAQIEIIDQVTGGWGNTRVDEIVFSDEPRLDRPRKRDVGAVAAEREVDAGDLERWVSALQEVEEGHPLDLVLRLAESEDPSAVQRAAQEQRDAWRAWLAETEVFAGFSDPDALDGWTIDGWAFDSGAASPTPAGAWLGAGEGARLATEGMLSSGATSRRLVGTLRSPGFDVHRPFLHVRARGRGAVRVIMDGYTLDEYNPLLYEEIYLRFDGDVEGEGEWQWKSHRLDRYVGHRGYYEIIADSRDAGLEIAEIRWSDSRDTPPPPVRAIEPLLATGSHLPSVLAAACGEAIGRVIAGEDDALGLALAQWAIDHGLAPVEEAGAGEGAGGKDGGADLHALRAQFEQVAKEIPAPRRAFVMEDAEPEDEYVFSRGDHRQRGEVAPRTFLGALCAGSPLIESETGSGRLELARKLLDEANPLPARVIVNRVWLHMMGEGIVATPDDFGLLGRLPTHPELLDDLAWRFRHEMGWSIKTLIREIALSSTYRMRSGTLSAEAARIDPDNELLSVRSPRRLQGEVLRDAMLAVSGRLDRTMYGRSVPIHLTDFMTGRGRPGRSGPLDGDGRRSIYLEVRRNFPVPMMSAFDAPVPHSTMGARLESNVPAQSLILLNDPLVVQQAELLAKRVIEEEASAEARVERLYRLALGRGASAEEMELAVEFLRRQSAELARVGHEGGGANGGVNGGAVVWEDDVGAWRDLCHIMFNLKEFSYIE